MGHQRRRGSGDFRVQGVRRGRILILYKCPPNHYTSLLDHPVADACHVSGTLVTKSPTQDSYLYFMTSERGGQYRYEASRWGFLYHFIDNCMDWNQLHIAFFAWSCTWTSLQNTFVAPHGTTNPEVRPWYSESYSCPTGSQSIHARFIR